MSYTIKYNYNTGDSFHTEENIEAILGIWNNATFAEENLKRIKEHYEYYNAIRTDYYSNAMEQAKNELIVKAAPSKPWYVAQYQFSLKLVEDSGKEFQISAPWCGYFESLNSVEIEENNPNHRYVVK